MLPELCRYSLEYGQDGRIGADPSWPITVFLQLGVSNDLVTRILEQMFEGQDVPFRGAGRARVVEWITYVVRGWVRDIARGGRPERGLENWVGELMTECETFIRSARSSNEGGMELAQLGREVREVKRAVDGLAGAGAGSLRGSMGFL